MIYLLQDQIDVLRNHPDESIRIAIIPYLLPRWIPSLWYHSICKGIYLETQNVFHAWQTRLSSLFRDEVTMDYPPKWTSISDYDQIIYTIAKKLNDLECFALLADQLIAYHQTPRPVPIWVVDAMRKNVLHENPVVAKLWIKLAALLNETPPSYRVFCQEYPSADSSTG